MERREKTSRTSASDEDHGDRVPLADRILDDLLPGDLDWRHLVTSYPLASLAVAVSGGFLLGRSRGSRLVAAFSAFALREVTQNINTFLGDDAVEP